MFYISWNGIPYNVSLKENSMLLKGEMNAKTKRFLFESIGIVD